MATISPFMFTENIFYVIYVTQTDKDIHSILQIEHKSKIIYNGSGARAA